MKRSPAFYRFLLFAGMLALSSCECDKIANGRTVQGQDSIPLDSVMISSALVRKGEVSRRDTFWSDSLGNFEYEDFFGVGLKRCPDLQLTFIKDSFLPQTIDDAGRGMIIWMQRE